MSNRLLLVLLCVLSWIGLTGTKATCGSSFRDPVPSKKPVCIGGRVTDENARGVRAAFVLTTPATSPQVTDQNGYFDICSIRKVVNKSTGETKPATIAVGNYVLKVTKEGFKTLSLKVNFQGKSIRFPKLVLKEKEFNGPDIKKTKKPVGRKDPSGTKGPVTGS